MNKSVIFRLILCLISFQALGDECIVLTDSMNELVIGKSIYSFLDNDGEFTINQVNTPEFIGKLKKSNQETPNFGDTKNFSVWNKFTIVNHSKKKWILSIENAILDTIELYHQDSAGVFQKTSEGQAFGWSQRKYKTFTYVFDLPPGKTDTAVYYLHIEAYLMIYPIILTSEERFATVNLERNLVGGLYVGFVVMIILYNLFLYLMVRDKNYLYYVIYVLLNGMMIGVLKGYMAFIWGDRFSYMGRYAAAIVALASAFVFVFTVRALETKRTVPVMHRIILWGFLPAYSISIILNLWGYTQLSGMLNKNIGSLGIIFLFVTSLVLYRRGYQPARYFVLACTIYFIGVGIFILRVDDLLPHSNLTYYAIEFGSAMEMILFSLVLADKINLYKNEKEAAQLKLLETLTEKERLITGQNKMLEEKVQERTKELEHTLITLKDAETQLVQSEKLASLGLLTAGIAHEINNPVNFVTASTPSLQRDFQDIKLLISKYDELETTPEVKSEIERIKQQLDISGTLTEIDTLLLGIHEGANRTSEIIKGLRNFSHVDISEMRPMDINQGINLTLSLLSQVMGYKIKIEKHFGKIPLVRCYSGKINQVLMNIFSNAIDAIPNEGVISIRTYYEAESVKISIKDSGTGMSEAVKAKIFEPFYTTKESGKGTGLGLSISHGIIKDHYGSIEVNSTLGEGTEFIISLPTND